MQEYTDEIFSAPNKILDWMDEEIKITPFIDISVHRLHQEKDNSVYINYKVSERTKINCQYMYRHLALQDVNLN
jgi:hypothetical protein